MNLLNAGIARTRLARMTLCLVAFVFALGLLSDTGLVSRTSSLVPAAVYAGNVFDDMFTIGADGALSTTSAGSEVDMQYMVTNYKNIALVITSVLTITMLIFMLIQFTKLGSAGDNEMARKRAIGGILTTGIATALLGGATVVVAFFWNVLNKATP